MNARTVFSLIKETIAEWQEDKASRLAAALTYYSIFSMAPLLLIVITIVGVLLEPSDVEGEIVGQIEELVGANGAEMIQTMIANVNQSDAKGFAAVVGIVTLVIGATSVFNALRDALNTIWNVERPAAGGLIGTIRSRLLSFSLIPAIGFLLLVSLIVDALLAAGRSYFSDVFPSDAWAWVIQVLNFVVSVGIITLMFAAIYKILPDVELAWSDVWIGAFVTAILFTIGRVLIGLYIGNSSAASTYGAAGSLIIILLWVYYSAQILFLGAEFTQVYTRRLGTQREGTAEAARVAPEGRAPEAATTATAALPNRVPSPREAYAAASPKGYAITGILAFLLGAVISRTR